MIQMLVQTIFVSAWVVLIAMSFSLVYRVAGFFHIAHGAVMYVGACVAVLVSNTLEWTIPSSVAVGIGSALSLGCMIELLVYRPLRARNAGALAALLASLGIMVILQGVAGLAWGTEPLSFAESVSSYNINWGAVTISGAQVIAIISTVVVVLLTWMLMNWTIIGRAIRAVASDRELASVSGIPVATVILFTFAFSSALGGLGGCLIALDVAATPDMAMNALLLGVVASIVGGTSTIRGPVLGAILISMLRHAAMWYGSSLWAEAIMFGLLSVFLLIRGGAAQHLKSAQTP